MSSLTLATFFFLRHLPEASGRGIGKPLRTTNRSRLVFRYTSNILQAPQPPSEYRGEQKWQLLRPAMMDRRAAADCGERRAGHNGADANPGGSFNCAIGGDARKRKSWALYNKSLARNNKTLMRASW
jgi:hypothetical protein